MGGHADPPLRIDRNDVGADLCVCPTKHRYRCLKYIFLNYSGRITMKVLITYFSQTGNTEKIASAIHNEAAKNHEVQSKQLKDISAADLAAFDFVFIGSPLHGGNLAAPVKEFLSSIKPGAGKKMAGFITHAADAYPDQDMDKFSEPIKAACKDSGMEYQGMFRLSGFFDRSLARDDQKKSEPNG